MERANASFGIGKPAKYSAVSRRMTAYASAVSGIPSSPPRSPHVAGMVPSSTGIDSHRGGNWAEGDESVDLSSQPYVCCKYSMQSTRIPLPEKEGRG